MVIEDPGQLNLSKGKESSKNTHYHLADPIDRLGAVIIDVFIVLLPILLLAISPFRLIISESLVTDNDLAISLGVTLAIISIVLIVTAYQTLTTWFFGGSLGKLFLGLRTVNVFNQKKPEFSACLLRSITWFLGILSLGFSFLSILSNQRRRTLHDRVSETMVVSRFHSGVEAPTIVESSVIKGIFAGFVVFVLLVGTITTYDEYQRVSAGSYLADLLEQQGGLCREIGEAYRSWPEEDAAPVSRMEIAMALFAAGTVGKECLEAETDFFFRQGKSNGMAYLAKAFIHSDRSSLSDAYLRRVCQVSDKKSSECKMSQMVEAWDEENWGKVSKTFETFNEKMPVYVRTWAIRSAMKEGDFILTRHHLEKLPAITSLKEFKMKFSAMSHLLGSSSSVFEELTSMALTNLTQNEGINLSAWTCFYSMAKSCTASASPACQFLLKSVDEDEEVRMNTTVSLTRLRMKECSNQAGPYSDDFNNVKELTISLSQLKENRQEGREALWGLAMDEDYSDRFRAEAARYYLDSAKTKDDLEKFRVYWSTQHKNLEWQITGKRLFDRLIMIKDFDSARGVGELIENYYEQDTEYLKSMVIADYMTDDFNSALKRLNLFEDGGRQPASSQDFKIISKELRSKRVRK